MTPFLFRFRGEILALWGIGAVAVAWPPKGCAWSVVPLICGLGLRIWARRHIGPHSRGRNLACPQRSVAGPYRWIDHPLYAANLLVVAAISLALAGPTPTALLCTTGPIVMYAVLAKAEKRFVRSTNAPERTTAHDLRSGKWISEWASTAPQIAIWGVLQFLSSR